MNRSALRLLAALSVMLPAVLEARTWKEEGSGRTLDGDYVRTEGTDVLIRKAGGAIVKVPLAKLSEEDRKFIAAQAPAAGQQLTAAQPAAEKDVFKWETDFKLAKQRAKAENKALLLDFTGSDWCGWCIKLKKEVFDQPAFQEYARKNLIMVELDFPRSKELDPKEKEQNQKLAQEYQIEGYPTIILLNARGREVARTGYQEGGPEKYVDHVKELLKQKRSAD
jgi:protein disulfide-isomerase